MDGITGAVGAWGGDGGRAVVWIAPAAVVAILDDDTRRDRVTLHLNETALFTFLKTLPKSQGFDQPQMIRLLRTTLANSVGKQEILAAVRKVKFRQLASGETSIQHGNESMGQQIENEVTGAADIPDTLVVDTPIYNNLGERDYSFPVPLDVEIVPTERKFVMRPIGDALEIAAQAGQLSIAERIRAAIPNTPVFFGSP